MKKNRKLKLMNVGSCWKKWIDEKIMIKREKEIKNMKRTEIRKQ